MLYHCFASFKQSLLERKDLGGVMSKDCKDTLQTLKTVTKRECDAK